MLQSASLSRLPVCQALHVILYGEHRPPWLTRLPGIQRMVILEDLDVIRMTTRKVHIFEPALLGTLPVWSWYLEVRYHHWPNSLKISRREYPLSIISIRIKSYSHMKFCLQELSSSIDLPDWIKLVKGCEIGGRSNKIIAEPTTQYCSLSESLCVCGICFG